ncbi:MAG: hypothetical protein R2779_11765 [Crocinitomicaceae bacterium]
MVVLALYFSELVDGKWTKLVPFEYNNDAYNVGHGCFSEDGRKLCILLRIWKEDMDKRISTKLNG